MEILPQSPPSSVQVPSPSGVPRSVHRAPDPRGGEPWVELRAAPPPGQRAAQPRVVGPGRRERTYRERIARLEGELEVSDLVGRGSQRRQARLEARLELAARERERLLAQDRERAQAERRLLVLLGALRRENLALRADLERLAPAPNPSLPAPDRRSLLARLFSRRRPARPPRP